MIKKYSVLLLVTLGLGAMEPDRPTSAQTDSSCGRVSVSESTTDSEIAEILLVLGSKRDAAQPLAHTPPHKRNRSQKKKFKCRIKGCKQSYVIESHRDKHERDRHGDTENFDLFTCDECGKTFRQEQLYNEHMLIHVRIHRKVPSLLCRYCKKPFYDQDARKCHIKMEHPGKSAKPTPYGTVHPPLHSMQDRKYTLHNDKVS